MYIESIKLMSSFDNKSLEKVTLKYTSTHEYSTSNDFKPSSFINSIPIKDDINYDNFSNNNRSVKERMKRHVHKLNEIFFEHSH